MIQRYASKVLTDLFDDKSRFEAYLKVEIEVLYGWAKLGVVPIEDVKLIEQKAKVDVNKINELEAITHHDVVAFTRACDTYLGEEKRWLHFGLTSTDVVDTALSYLYKQANSLIEKELEELIQACKQKALEYKNTPCIARSHGMHAEVTSFGLKWALYYDELNRDLQRFKLARKDLEACKISGSVGNFANIPSQVQDYVAASLGLTNTNISTQVLQRDRHSYYASVVAIIGSTIEKICCEIRNLSRSEIHELEEGFSKGQKGSSSMPQKRNPISSENLTGASRMLRGYLQAILEDNALYHERDISHSSVERVALIDLIELFEYMVKRMTKVINNLNIFPDQMLKNIDITKQGFFSQRVMNSIILKGYSREEAYDLIQPLAMKAVMEGKLLSTQLKENDKFKQIFTPSEIDELFDISYYLKNVDTIYSRVGLN